MPMPESKESSCTRAREEKPADSKRKKHKTGSPRQKRERMLGTSH